MSNSRQFRNSCFAVIPLEQLQHGDTVILHDTKDEVIQGILLRPYIQGDKYTRDGRQI